MCLLRTADCQLLTSFITFVPFCKSFMATEKILVIGSSGQIGSELVEELRIRYGDDNVIASDIKAPQGVIHKGPFEALDVLYAAKVIEIIHKYDVKQIYLLAAMLSATAEQKIKLAWHLNMDG